MKSVFYWMAFYLRGIISVISWGDINQTYFSIAINLIEIEMKSIHSKIHLMAISSSIKWNVSLTSHIIIQFYNSIFVKTKYFFEPLSLQKWAILLTWWPHGFRVVCTTDISIFLLFKSSSLFWTSALLTAWIRKWSNMDHLRQKIIIILFYLEFDLCHDSYF